MGPYQRNWRSGSLNMGRKRRRRRLAPSLSRVFCFEDFEEYGTFNNRRSQSSATHRLGTVTTHHFDFVFCRPWKFPRSDILRYRPYHNL